MSIKVFEKTGLSIALAAAFLVVAGVSNAFAQDWRQLNFSGEVRTDNRRMSAEERKGIKDGEIAGRRDALARLRNDPAGSIRYQLGGAEYRIGFQSGYDRAYRQYADNNARRDSDSYDIRVVNGNNLYRQGGYYDRSGNFHKY